MSTVYENLEEISIGAMIELSDAEVPYCAFNGGNDVFVDVGNKNIGLQTLMNYLGFDGDQTLHVGDRFTSTGNDSRVRDACSMSLARMSGSPLVAAQTAGTTFPGFPFRSAPSSRKKSTTSGRCWC